VCAKAIKRNRRVDGRTDPWEILGVEPTATEKEIKKAHRKMVMKHHPDLHGGTGDAKIERKFIAIQEAYEMLIGRREMRGNSASVAGQGKDGWSFHDWFWGFTYARRARNMKGKGAHVKPPPPPAGHWREQVVDLKRRAAIRRMTRRKNENVHAAATVHETESYSMQSSGKESQVEVELPTDDSNIQEELHTRPSTHPDLNSVGEGKEVHGASSQHKAVPGVDPDVLSRTYAIKRLDTLRFREAIKKASSRLKHLYEERTLRHDEMLELVSNRFSKVSSHIASFRKQLSHGKVQAVINVGDVEAEKSSSEFETNEKEHKDRTNTYDEQGDSESRPSHLSQQLAGLKRRSALKQQILK